MAFRRGEVVLVRYPFSDLSAVKARPAVVLSSAEYHQAEPDVIVAAITSNLTAANGAMDYVLADWSAAGLRFPSALKPLIFTLEPRLILHRIGFLSANDFAEVERRVRLALGLASLANEMLKGLTDITSFPTAIAVINCLPLVCGILSTIANAVGTVTPPGATPRLSLEE